MTEQHRSTISRNSLIYIIANVAGHFYVLVTMPVLTHYLSAEEFGFYIILVQVVIIIQTLGQALFAQPLLRFFVEYEGEDQKKFVGTVFLSTFLFQFLAATLLYAARNVIFPWLYPNITLSLDPYVMLACVWSVVIAVRSLSTTFIKIRENPAGLIKQNVIYGCLLVGILVLFIGFLERGLGGALESLILAELGTQIYIIRYIRDSISPSLKLEYIRRCLIFSTPLLGSAFLFLAFANIDRIILSRYVGLAEIGIYGLGLTIGNMVAMVLSAFVSSYTPRMISVVKNEGEVTSGELLERLILDNIALMGLAVGTLYLCNGLLVSLLGRSEGFNVAGLVVVGVATGHFVRSLHLFFQNTLFYQYRTKAILALNAGILVIGLMLANMLVNFIGMYGMAFLNALVYLIILPLGYRLASKRVTIQLPVRSILKAFTAIGILVAIEVLLEKSGVSINTLEYWIVKSMEAAIILFMFSRGFVLFVQRGLLKRT